MNVLLSSLDKADRLWVRWFYKVQRRKGEDVRAAREQTIWWAGAKWGRR